MKRFILVGVCALAVGFVSGISNFNRPARAQIIIGPGDPDPGVISCPGGGKPMCVRCSFTGNCVRACYGGAYCDCPRTPHRCGF
jgi:hypothetical protein